MYFQIERCQIKSKVLKEAFGKKRKFSAIKKNITQIAKKDPNLWFLSRHLCDLRSGVFTYIYLNISCISAREYIIYKF